MFPKWQSNQPKYSNQHQYFICKSIQTNIFLRTHIPYNARKERMTNTHQYNIQWFAVACFQAATTPAQTTLWVQKVSAVIQNYKNSRAIFFPQWTFFLFLFIYLFTEVWIQAMEAVGLETRGITVIRIFSNYSWKFREHSYANLSEISTHWMFYWQGFIVFSEQ